jgi:uncharacterized coiled-coil DUF342 family protein
MSENKETILSQLDELKTSISQALDQIESLETETEELRGARREAEEKAWSSEQEVKKITQEMDQLKEERNDTNSKITELEDTISSSESKINSLEEELEVLKSKADQAESSKNEAVSELQRERDELKAEMDDITSKLTRVSELYREASAEKEKLQEKVDVSDLLSIYIMLLETVFYGKPHARILYMLHDTKAPITRKNIAQSSGIQPAVVQKAIFDLANADLVSYNDETQEVNLIKEIL